MFGVGDGNTSITGAINYYKRNSIFNRDRGFSLKPPFLSSNSTPENLQLSSDVVVASGVNPAVLPHNADGTLVPVIIRHGADWFQWTFSFELIYLTRLSGRAAPGSILPGFDFNLFSSSFPRIESYGGFANFSHKIFGDQMVAFGDIFLPKRVIA